MGTGVFYTTEVNPSGDLRLRCHMKLHARSERQCEIFQDQVYLTQKTLHYTFINKYINSEKLY